MEHGLPAFNFDSKTYFFLGRVIDTFFLNILMTWCQKSLSREALWAQLGEHGVQNHPRGARTLYKSSLGLILGRLWNRFFSKNTSEAFLATILVDFGPSLASFLNGFGSLVWSMLV